MGILILKDGSWSKSKAAHTVRQILRASAVSISTMPFGLEFLLRGELAKIPSSMNSKWAFNDKRGKARIMRAPEFQLRLEALTTWANHVSPPPFRKCLKLDKDSRAFVLIACADCMSRMDTHNIPKAVCDWLQKNNFINNDKFVDALALSSRMIWPNAKEHTDSKIYLIEHDAQFKNAFERTLRCVFKFNVTRE